MAHSSDIGEYGAHSWEETKCVLFRAQTEQKFGADLIYILQFWYLVKKINEILGLYQST